MTLCTVIWFIVNMFLFYKYHNYIQKTRACLHYCPYPEQAGNPLKFSIIQTAEITVGGSVQGRFPLAGFGGQ